MDRGHLSRLSVATGEPYVPEARSHQGFAARVGHRFAQDYQSSLRLEVYESLLDLADKASSELSSLKPRDRIDVQSFIWVIGDYRDERDASAP